MIRPKPLVRVSRPVIVFVCLRLWPSQIASCTSFYLRLLPSVARAGLSRKTVTSTSWQTLNSFLLT